MKLLLTLFVSVGIIFTAVVTIEAAEGYPKPTGGGSGTVACTACDQQYEREKRGCLSIGENDCRLACLRDAADVAASCGKYCTRN
jgi:hypothetical protein